MPVRINTSSFLNNSELLSYKGVTYWSRTDYATIPPDRTDETYTVKEHDRIDQIAQAFYGEPRLWWVVAMTNNLHLVSVDMVPGMEIRIPTIDRLEEELEKAELNREVVEDGK